MVGVPSQAELRLFTVQIAVVVNALVGISVEIGLSTVLDYLLDVTLDIQHLLVVDVAILERT